MNNYLYRNTFIHKINPLMKFLPFLMIVVLVFFKTDFLIQIVVFSFVFFFWFLARIPLVRLKQIFLSYFVMFILLFLINWIAEKNPLNISTDNIDKSVFFGPKIHNQTGYIQTGGSLWGELIVTDKTDNSIAKIFDITAAKKDIAPVKAASDQIWSWVTNLSNNFNHNGFGKNHLRLQQISTYVNAADKTLHYKYMGYLVKWYGISNFAWLSAIYVSNKLLIVILASTIFTATTSTVELTYAFEDVLRPLKYLKFPANELAMVLSIAIRFIPSLIAESLWIMKSQASRGIDFKNGNLFAKINSLTSLIVPLFTISFLKADDLANAMTARSYNPRYARTRFRTFSLHSADIIGFLILTGVLAFLYYLASRKFVLGSFGVYNALIVLGR